MQHIRTKKFLIACILWMSIGGLRAGDLELRRKLVEEYWSLSKFDEILQLGASEASNGWDMAEEMELPKSLVDGILLELKAQKKQRFIDVLADKLLAEEIEVLNQYLKTPEDQRVEDDLITSSYGKVFATFEQLMNENHIAQALTAWMKVMQDISTPVLDEGSFTP